MHVCTSLGGFYIVTERVALHIFPYHKTLSQEPKFANNNSKLIFLSLFFRSVWIRVQVKLSVLMNFFAIFHSGKVGSANKIIIYENYTMKMMRMLQFIHLFFLCWVSSLLVQNSSYRFFFLFWLLMLLLVRKLAIMPVIKRSLH